MKSVIKNLIVLPLFFLELMTQVFNLEFLNFGILPCSIFLFSLFVSILCVLSLDFLIKIKCR